MAPPNSILAEQEREGLDPRFALSTHPAMDRCKEQEIGAIRTETGREQRRERRGRRNWEMETGEEGVGTHEFRGGSNTKTDSQSPGTQRTNVHGTERTVSKAKQKHAASRS
uniref:Uncharacterized protein n=1 Tax=Oryza glumipatula TaxID=40148 RepID=A0A0D9YJ79_9ORYZ